MGTREVIPILTRVDPSDIEKSLCRSVLINPITYQAKTAPARRTSE